MRIAKYLKPYFLQISVLLVLTLGQVLADLQLPDFMASIVNKGVIGGNTDLILGTGLWMLIISLIGAACAVAVGFLSARIASGYSMNLRVKVFSKVENFSLAEFDKFSTASLITRSSNDIQQIQMALIMIFRMVLLAPIMGIGAVYKAYTMAPSMTWIIALALLIVIGTILALFTIAMPKFKLQQKLVDRLNLVTRENLTGLRVIRAFNTEEHEQEKFDRSNSDLTGVGLYINRLMVVMHPMMMLVFNITSIAIVWIGAHMIGSGDLLVGDMIAFMQYAMQVIMSFLLLSMVFIMIPRASVSAQRVAEVIDTEPAIKNPQTPVSFSEDAQGFVEFKNVTFSYPGADSPVLQNISFSARPGEVTAIIGSTGSGKSTLINLIPRFYDVTGGRVLIDNIDVRDVTQEDLRKKIGYIPQKGILFSGTIESNIKYGVPDASDEELSTASRIAQADEFIARLDNQLETPISQGGTNVSGGQRQRLSIARALIKKPDIYIFDDSFSALDFITDAALRDALSDEIKGATVLIVAQRISTIMNADKIIVLDKGKIAGIGRHKDLLEECRVYEEIASSQFSEEELTSSLIDIAEGNNSQFAEKDFA